MKITYIILIIAISITGCDSSTFDDPIKKAVREKLKDPDSAKFSNQISMQNHACISVNAKNSFGGYTGERYAHLKSYNGNSWSVETIDDTPCDTNTLKDKVAKDNATAAAIKALPEKEKALLEKLKAKKLIDPATQSISSIKDEKCRKFADDLMSFITIADSIDSEVLRQYHQDKIDEGMKAIDSGLCG